MTKASPSPRQTASWPIVVAILAAVAMGVAALSAASSARFDLQGSVLPTFLFGGSGLIVGVVILRRQPDHGVGWACLAGGVLFTVGFACRELAFATIVDLPDGARAVFGLLASAAPVTSLALLGPVLVAVFPSGRFGTTGRRVAIGYLICVVPLVLLSTVTTPFVNLDGSDLPNPMYVSGLLIVLPIGADSMLIAAYVTSVVLASAGLAIRYRSADTIGRLQIRWLAANLIALIATVALVFAFPDTLGEALWWLMFVFAGLTPVTVAIAVTRYRLYEIDRIVGKTVTYGLVTLLLFATFLVANLSLQRLLVSLTGVGSPLAVAASTLLVAALFNPIRGRVQGIVDRRFHRARYDADQLVSGFAGRLRDEMDLGALHREIVATVDGSVEPSGVNLWLRRSAL